MRGYNNVSLSLLNVGFVRPFQVRSTVVKPLTRNFELKTATQLSTTPSRAERQEEDDEDDDKPESRLGNYYRERGLEFEKLAVVALKSYGFELNQRNANKTQADEGIDLTGHWRFAAGLPVAVQCKKMNKAIPVRVVRELESSVQRMASQLANEPKTVLGILAVGTELSPAAKKWFLQSSCLLAMAVIKEDRPLCEFSMNPSFCDEFPGLRVVRQYNRQYASFVDVIVKTSD